MMEYDEFLETGNGQVKHPVWSIFMHFRLSIFQECNDCLTYKRSLLNNHSSLLDSHVAKGSWLRYVKPTMAAHHIWPCAITCPPVKLARKAVTWDHNPRQFGNSGTKWMHTKSSPQLQSLFLMLILVIYYVLILQHSSTYFHTLQPWFFYLQTRST